MKCAGWKLPPSAGKFGNHWSIAVSRQLGRLTSVFDGEDAILVNYLDYH